jgi:hypothetical protein
MSTKLEGIIFDYSTILIDDSKRLESVRMMLNKFRDAGIKIILFSTHKKDFEKALFERNLPMADLVVIRDMVKEMYPSENPNKGSRAWIQAVTEKTGVPYFKLLYVGDGISDWRTAINSSTIYLHANWADSCDYGSSRNDILQVDSPEEVYKFASHFLMLPPRWGFSLDSEEDNLCLRCLSPVSYPPGTPVRFEASSPRSSFSLNDVLTYEKEIYVGGYSASEFLVIHAITSLSLEGKIPRDKSVFFTIYPSSSTSNVKPPLLQDFVEKSAKFFHGFIKNDLLIRTKDAPDTSKLRAQNERDRVTISTQTATIRIGEKYREKLSDKTIVVFDDFATSGKSFECARNLLYAAGVKEVILVSIGKYGTGHEIYAPSIKDLNPYDMSETYKLTFQKRRSLTVNAVNLSNLQRSFKLWKADCDYSVE